MKKFSMLKHFGILKFIFFLVLVLTVQVGKAAGTTLAPGDVALLGINADNPDMFSFVILKDIATSTVINFTDNGFTGSNTTGRTGENFLIFTASKSYPAGTVFTWTNNGSTSAEGDFNSGNPSNFSFNASGDQLFIFQGSTSNWASQSGITLLYGINYGKALSGTSDASATLQPSTTILPAADFVNFPSTSTNDLYYTTNGSAATSVSLFGSPSALFTELTTTSRFVVDNGALTFPTKYIFGIGTLSAVNTTYGTASSPATSFQITSTGLSANISLAALSGFEFSTSSGGTYASTLSLTQSSGIVNSSVFIRLAATTAVGTYSGNMVFTSSGAQTLNVATVSSTVSKKALSVTADNKTVTYGDAVPTLTYTLSGFVNGQTSSVVSGVASLSTSYSATTGVASSPVTITAAAGTLSATNYSFTLTNGTITINKKALSVTADNKTATYGDAVPTLTYTLSGFVNNQTASVVSGVPTLNTTYTNTKLPSQSPIAITGTINTLTAANYSFSTVTPGSITITASGFIWTGNHNSDWSTGSNWDGNNAPSGTDNIIIASNASNFPILTGDIALNNLNLRNGTTFNINGNKLTINGAISGNGTLTGSATSKLILGGNAGTLNFTPGGQILDSLALNTNATATLGSYLNIAAGTSKPGTLTIGNSAIFNTADGLTLLSDDNNTAMVGPVSGTINGQVTVQRSVHSSQNLFYSNSGNTSVNNAKRAWRLLTAPISGTQTIFDAWQDGAPSTYIPGAGTFITGANADINMNGLDGGLSGSYSMKSFNANEQTLENVSTTKVAISGNSGSAANKGYFIFIRGDRDPATIGNPNSGGVLINNITLSAKGNLQTGTQTFNIQSSADVDHPKYALIGNPYMSPVDLNLLTYHNVAPFIYTWDPNLNQVGGYVTLFGGPGQNDFTVSTPNDGSTFQDNILQSSQAFFVYGGLTENGSSSVVFTEASKSALNNNKVFRPATGGVSFRSNLYLLNPDSSIRLADGCLAQYDNAYCACVDFYDANKLSNINEQLGLTRGTHLLSIESRPIITAPDTLFLNLTKTTQRDYSYHFLPLSIDQPGMQAFLKDSYLADSTELSLTDSTVVNFNINADVASQAADRFMVVFKPAGIVPVTYTNVKAYQQNTAIAVQWSVTNQQNIKQYVIERSMDGVMPVIKADYSLIQQVCMNLILNAVKYSGKKSKPLIEISSKKINKEFVFSVSDNGVGFDMEYADKLFGVFQRLHSEEEFAGTGVGLAIVQRIIYKHNGKVWAKGKINKGATFYFTIPEI